MLRIVLQTILLLCMLRLFLLPLVLLLKMKVLPLLFLKPKLQRVLALRYMGLFILLYNLRLVFLLKLFMYILIKTPLTNMAMWLCLSYCLTPAVLVSLLMLLPIVLLVCLVKRFSLVLHYPLLSLPKMYLPELLLLPGDPLMTEIPVSTSVHTFFLVPSRDSTTPNSAASMSSASPPVQEIPSSPF